MNPPLKKGSVIEHLLHDLKCRNYKRKRKRLRRRRFNRQLRQMKRKPVSDKRLRKRKSALIKSETAKLNRTLRRRRCR